VGGAILIAVRRKAPLAPATPAVTAPDASPPEA